MSSSFDIIGTAWGFYRKHPVLNAITFWLLFAPVAAMHSLIGFVETAVAEGASELPHLMAETELQGVFMIPVVAVLIYLLFWGQACILIVAKRMVASPAGRNRTSFKAVRLQAKKYIWSLLLTELLRGLLIFLWSLLLIVPGIIYAIRTMFYDIMLIEGGKVVYGRTMLQRSQDFVKGNTGSVLLRVIGIFACVMLPPLIFTSFLREGMTALDPRLITLAYVLSDFIEAYAGMFFVLCIVSLYADLKKV